MKLLRAWLLVVITTARLNGLEPEPDWWQTQRDLTTRLLVSNTPIGQLTRTVTARPAGEGPAAMFKVGVLWPATNDPAYWSKRGLEELAQSGLRDDLAAFYRQMAEDLPASLAPARALQRLGADRR